MFKVNQKEVPPLTRLLPYSFSVRHGSSPKTDVIPMVLEWLYINVGSYNHEIWQVRAIEGSNLMVYFAEESDAMAFKMAWMEQ